MFVLPGDALTQHQDHEQIPAFGDRPEQLNQVPAILRPLLLIEEPLQQLDGRRTDRLKRSHCRFPPGIVALGRFNEFAEHVGANLRGAVLGQGRDALSLRYREGGNSWQP